MAIKTVKCPKCDSETAVIKTTRERCFAPFAGEEITDVPEVGEGEQFEYSDTPNDEQKNKKIVPFGEEIDVSFVLSEIEVGNALETSGKLKKRKIIPYIEAVLFGLLGLFSLLSIIFSYAGLLGMGKNKPQLSHYLVTVVCFCMVPAVFTLPDRQKKKYIRAATTGNEVNLKIFDNVLEVCVLGNEDEGWQLELNGDYGINYEKEQIVLSLKTGQILVIPDRAVREDQLEKLHGRFGVTKDQQELQKA